LSTIKVSFKTLKEFLKAILYSFLTPRLGFATILGTILSVYDLALGI
jgi:hypothetical protein